MNLKDWKVIQKKKIFTGQIFHYHQIHTKQIDGHLEGYFDVLEFYRWVNIIAQTSTGDWIMVRQFRQGSLEMSLEIPGGAVNPEEDPLIAAKRELREETGYISDQWSLLGVMRPNPAIMDNTCHVYLAENAKYEGELQLDPLEDIEVQLMAREQVNDYIHQGQIHHSLVLAAIQYYDIRS